MLLLRGHSAVVQDLAFSPDGRRLVSTGLDQTVRIWDLDAGVECFRMSLSLTLAPKHGVAVSPDSQIVAAIDGPRIQLWRLDSGIPLGWLPNDSAQVEQKQPPGRVVTIAFRPSDGWLTGTGYGGYWSAVRTWQPATGRAAPSWTPDSILDGYALNLAYSADGSRIAMLGHPAFNVWSLPGRRLIMKQPGCNDYDHAPLGLSPDGRLAAYGRKKQLFVIALDGTNTGFEIRSTRRAFNDAAFHPDGRTLATVDNDDCVRCWDAATGRLIRSYAWSGDNLKCLAFAADGLRAACAGAKGSIVVWDVDDC